MIELILWAVIGVAIFVAIAALTMPANYFDPFARVLPSGGEKQSLDFPPIEPERLEPPCS